MNKTLGSFAALLLLLVSEPAYAKKQHRHRQPPTVHKVEKHEARSESWTLRMCDPTSVDGTQVVERANGTCAQRSPGVTDWIADFKYEVLCPVPGLKCIPVAKLNQGEVAKYLYLRGFARPAPGFRSCDQWHGKDFKFESVTGPGSYSCNPAQHAIRQLNFVSREVCVMDGKAMIGCFPMPEGATISNKGE